jgi:exopolysaccharide production protein ExoQ
VIRPDVLVRHRFPPVRIDRRILAGVAAAGFLVIVGLIVAGASWTGRDIQAAAIAGAGFVILLSLRWPLLPLFGVAVLIPFEQAVVIGDLGTLSRYAELLFIVSYGIPRLGRLSVRAMPVPAFGFVLWAIFSVTWAIDPTPTSAALPALVLVLVVAVLVASAVVEDPSIIRPVMWAYSLAAGATAMLGIATFVILGGGNQDGRIAGLTDQNPAYFAAILLPAIVFTLNELLHGRWLITSAAIALAGTVGIAISGTRGAWLSLAVVVIVFLLPRLDPLRRAAAVVLVLALVLITLQIPGIAALVNERTDTALSSGGAGRTDIWTVGLSIIESAPVTGVGLSNFAIANSPELLRASSVQTTDPESLANLEAHNLVISTLGELGIVGFVLLAVFLVPLVVRRGWGPDADFVQAGLASLVIIAMFQDMLARKELWLLIGMAAGLAYLKKQEALLEMRRSVGASTVAPSGVTS